MQESATYCVPPHIDLVLRPCGPETLVYNCAAAETHLLDGPGAAVLSLLLDGPQLLHSLEVKLSPDLPPSHNGETSAYIEAMLQQLCKVGLAQAQGGL